MRISIKLIFILSGVLFLSSCVTIAPPPPLMTFGGPQTTIKGSSDAAIGVGSGAALFKDAHTPGQGWFGRYKYGLSEKWDIGIDALGFSYSDKYTFTAKLAARYQLHQKFRLEAGIGVADDSNGKSINGDFGLTFGSVSSVKVWNYYTTLRIAYAKGLPGNILSLGSSSSSDAPSDAAFAILNLGTQAKISDNMKFIFEGGYGFIFPIGHPNGQTFYVSCGLLFNLNKTK